jgi:hypothetical protein
MESTASLCAIVSQRLDLIRPDQGAACMNSMHTGIMPCATFNRPFPEVQLTQTQKLITRNFKGTSVLKSLQ